MRKLLAKNLLFFANDYLLWWWPSNTRVHLCQRSEQPFLEFAPEFGLNNHCLLSIILNIAEFLFLLKSEHITLEVKTKPNVDRFTSLGKRFQCAAILPMDSVTKQLKLFEIYFPLLRLPFSCLRNKTFLGYQLKPLNFTWSKY